MRVATELEGHADNAAAALHGGVVAVAGRHVVRIPLARDLTVVAWIPEGETATASARRLLPDQVTFEDAVFNVGRTALLVAALAAGAVDAMHVATEDRLHQNRRLARARDTHARDRCHARRRRVRRVALGLGPVGCGLRRPRVGPRIVATLPKGGRTLVLDIDDEGAIIT